MERAFRLRRWRGKWDDFQQSMWYLPTWFTLGAVVLYSISIYLDFRLGLSLSPRTLPEGWRAVVFSGGPSAAQDLLTNISGMWATIVGISFSVTLVTIQLTATKYIAQVLPLFERNRLNQAVLGAYLATVTYALLVAKTIRVEPPAFVPYISVNIALILAIVSIFLLILFVTNTVNLVRPQYFLEQTLSATQANLIRMNAAPRAWRVTLVKDEEKAKPPAGAFRIRALSRGILTDIAWNELAQVLSHRLGDDPAGGPWQIFLDKSVGQVVRENEVLGYLVHPEGSPHRDHVARAVAQACTLRPYTRPSDNVDSGIEALTGVTIKGAVQGDLDVTFAGVDCLFSLLTSLAALPNAQRRFVLKDTPLDVTVNQPASHLLAKWVRELTVVSEVALAPSLPFRLVTEGISRRLTIVLTELASDGNWEAFDRILTEARAWYESAFFHVDWVNGMYHLADDLTEVALHVHRLPSPSHFEAVLSFMRHNRDRLADDAQAREVLDNAFRRIERETRA